MHAEHNQQNVGVSECVLWHEMRAELWTRGVCVDDRDWGRKKKARGELPPRVKEVSAKEVGEQGASERLREWAACAIE